MTGHRRPRARVFVVVGAFLLVAAHIIVLRFATSHVVVPAAVALGVIALVLILHRRFFTDASTSNPASPPDE